MIFAILVPQQNFHQYIIPQPLGQVNPYGQTIQVVPYPPMQPNMAFFQNQYLPNNLVGRSQCQLQQRIPVQIIQRNLNTVQHFIQPNECQVSPILNAAQTEEEKSEDSSYSEEKEVESGIGNDDNIYEQGANLKQVAKIQDGKSLNENLLDQAQDHEKVSIAKQGKQRKEIYKFKLSCVNSTSKESDMMESNIRSDVLYKTIIRDMRKFFSKDFNQITMFIKRKRYKSEQYFFMCLKEYLRQRFNEFEAAIEENQNTQVFRPSSDFNDLLYFLGCLLYPKDIEIAMKPFARENLPSAHTSPEGNPKEKQEHPSFNTIHSYLYSFSLEKLNNLVNLKYFAYFYCFYFKFGILKGQRLEKKATMNKHLDSYSEACNLILQLCQVTLQKALQTYKGKPEYAQVEASILNYLELKEKPLKFNNSKQSRPLQYSNQHAETIPSKRQSTIELAKLEEEVAKDL